MVYYRTVKYDDGKPILSSASIAALWMDEPADYLCRRYRIDIIRSIGSALQNSKIKRYRSDKKQLSYFYIADEFICKTTDVFRRGQLLSYGTSLSC